MWGWFFFLFVFCFLFFSSFFFSLFSLFSFFSRHPTPPPFLHPRESQMEEQYTHKRKPSYEAYPEVFFLFMQPFFFRLAHERKIVLQSRPSESSCKSLKPQPSLQPPPWSSLLNLPLPTPRPPSVLKSTCPPTPLKPLVRSLNQFLRRSWMPQTLQAQVISVLVDLMVTTSSSSRWCARSRWRPRTTAILCRRATITEPSVFFLS